MANQPYTTYTLTSKDISIIRQHFANDTIIDYLWSKRKNKTEYEVAKREVTKFLDDMVEIIVKPPSETFIKKITTLPTKLEQKEIKKDKYGNVHPF